MTSASPRLRVWSAAQIADYAPGSSFGPRWVPDFELVWLLEGSALWRQQHPRPDGALGPWDEQLLTPGTLALARRGSRDAYRWHPSRPSRHAYVHFGIENLADLDALSDWSSTRSMSGVPVLAGLCDYLIELAGYSSDAARRRSDQAVELIVDIFLNGPLPEGPAAFPDSLRAMVDDVRRDWAECGMRVIGVDSLAAAASLSSGHLHRLFRDQYGCGPARALELIRLARAAISLQRSNAPLSVIAAETGFANPYHFSRRFSLTYGCPPGAFRKLEEMVDPLGPIRRARLLAIAHRLL